MYNLSHYKDNKNCNDSWIDPLNGRNWREKKMSNFPKMKSADQLSWLQDRGEASFRLFLWKSDSNYSVINSYLYIFLIIQWFILCLCVMTSMKMRFGKFLKVWVFILMWILNMNQFPKIIFILLLECLFKALNYLPLWLKLISWLGSIWLNHLAKCCQIADSSPDVSSIARS